MMKLLATTLLAVSLLSCRAGANTDVNLNDSTGTPITSTSGALDVNVTGGGGGGTQYSQGATQSTPTGTVAMGKDNSNVLKALGLDASGNLNVNLAAGSISGGNAAAGATGAAVPASAGYTAYNSGGNLVGVSTSNPLPVSQQGTVTIAGTVNLGTLNGVALDATLTGGTAKSVVRSAAKGSSAAADVTSTATDANHQALDVNVNNPVAVTNAALTSIDSKVPASPATAGNQTTANTSLASIVTNTTSIATSAKQDTGNASLASIDGKIPASPATTGKQDTGNTSLASIDSKTPASPATAGNQTTGNSSLSSIDGKLATSGSNGLKVDVPALEQAATPTRTQIASSITSVSVLASNPNRRKFMLVNESTQVCYVTFGATATTVDYSLRMWPNSVYTDDPPIYTGAISAIWPSANGGLKVTELAQ